MFFTVRTELYVAILQNEATDLNQESPAASNFLNCVACFLMQRVLPIGITWVWQTSSDRLLSLTVTVLVVKICDRYPNPVPTFDLLNFPLFDSSSPNSERRKPSLRVLCQF
ncbi:hypothetical protein [Nostoc sp. DSM 114161]|uniref:hypothetical protein n=1 Tax=Nostoc sp. DSM 114161 TaxID=3440143 RepID=UPI0040463763